MFYKVTLWCGAGYTLNKPVVVEARDEEEALVLASIKDGNCIFKEDFTIEDMDELDASDTYIYLDRTEYGHSVGYLLIENAIIEEVGYKVTGYLEAKKRGITASDTFLDMGEAFAMAWEYMQQGLYVEVRNIETGEKWEGNPDNPEGIFDQAHLSI